MSSACPAWRGVFDNTRAVSRLIAGVLPVLLTLGMIVFAATDTGSAHAAKAIKAAVIPLPAQGVYDQCAPATQMDVCREHLQRLSAAGFKVILNYTTWSATPQELGAYADAAAAAGVKVLWPLNAAAWRDGSSQPAAYKRLASGCTCGDDVLTWLLGFLKDHPATYGWYVADELGRDQQAAVQSLAAKVRSLDPHHPLVIVQNGMHGVLGGDITPFLSSSDIAGADVYPAGTGQGADYVGSSMAAAQQQTAAAGKRFVAVLQSFSWGAYPSQSPTQTPRWPTAAEMQAYRDATLRQSSPSLILWYSLNDIERSDDPGRRWSDLVAAAMAPPPTIETASTRSVLAKAARAKTAKRRSTTES